MRDEKEERKKQARSNKQTRQSNTAHPRQSLFLEKMSCLGYMYMCMYMYVSQQRDNLEYTYTIYMYMYMYVHAPVLEKMCTCF